MYLHLGQAVLVPFHDVIGVFDLDITSQSHLTRGFLERAEREGSVTNVSDELPKSFIVCHPPVGARGQAPGAAAGAPVPAAHRKGERAAHQVHISQLASSTLLRRAEGNSFE